MRLTLRLLSYVYSTWSQGQVWAFLSSLKHTGHIKRRGVQYGWGWHLVNTGGPMRILWIGDYCPGSRDLGGICDWGCGGSSGCSGTLLPSVAWCWFSSSFFFFLIYLWLCWVFVSVQGLSPVAASGGHSSSRCAGLSLSRPLLLRSTGSRRAGSVVVVHGPSCSAACGTFPDQGSNPCPLHWQADSQPLRHQGSPDFHHLYHRCAAFA